MARRDEPESEGDMAVIPWPAHFDKWVGYCVVCLQERWMTKETASLPCGLCQWNAARAEGVES